MLEQLDSCKKRETPCRVNNTIVVYVCPMNFVYVFIVPGPILRHLGEFGKIPGENTRFLPEKGQYGYL